MDIKTAANLVAKKYPGRIPKGYWIKDGIIIINTKPIRALKGLTAPSQFAVTERGEVYGVNPTLYDLHIEDMKKLF